MAVRGWGSPVATAIGVAAGAGAAQLGLGYGLGIIAWIPAADDPGKAVWMASLAWATWIAANSTAFGAICAQRWHPYRPITSTQDMISPAAAADPVTGRGQAAGSGPMAVPVAVANLPWAPMLWRIALALVSAVGGLVTVVLVAVPARTATRVDQTSPSGIAAMYALIGVLIGLVVALWALSSPAIAGNLISTASWLWSLAVVAVVDGVVSDQSPIGARLGVWQLASTNERFWFRDHYWPGAALSLGAALVIGLLCARPAAQPARHRVSTALSGIAGPLLVVAVYVLTTPRLVDFRTEQGSALLLAPYVVLAGLAGSALVAAIAQRAEPTAGSEPTATGPPGPTGTAGAPGAIDAPAPDGSSRDGAALAGPVPPADLP